MHTSEASLVAATATEALATILDSTTHERGCWNIGIQITRWVKGRGGGSRFRGCGWRHEGGGGG